MRRIITTIIIFFIPYLVLSNDFNLRKELIGEKNTEMVSIGEVESDQFDYRKPLIFKKTDEDKGFLGLLEIGDAQSGDNDSKIMKEPGSRIRLLLGTPFTIQYIHSSGFGISTNNIKDTIYQNGSKNYFNFDVTALSYTFFQDQYNYGFGVSSFSGKSKTSGCPSNDICYSDASRTIKSGSLLQAIISYEIFDFLEVSLGFNSIYFRLMEYKYSDDNTLTNDADGNLGITYYSKNTISIGTGYIF